MSNKLQQGHAATKTPVVSPSPVPLEHVHPVIFPDLAYGEDLLGVENEARALAAMIASPELQPPLTIGLLGDWGSGKTFLMGKLREAVEQLVAAPPSTDSDNTGLLHKIVQVEFNAWRFNEANVWSALVSQLFEGLKQGLSKPLEPLLARLETSMQLREEAESELQIARTTQKMAQRTKAQIDDRLEATQEGDAYSSVKVQSVLARYRINDMVMKLTGGVTPQDPSVFRELIFPSGVLHNRISLYFTRYLTALASRRSIWALGALLVFLIVPTIQPEMFVKLKNTIFMEYLTAYWNTLRVFLVGIVYLVVGFVGVDFWRIRRGLPAVVEAFEIACEDRRESEQEIESLRDKQIDAQHELKFAQERMEQAEEVLRRSSSSSGVAQYVENRMARSEGAKQLGLLDQLRRDLEHLQMLLSDPQADAENRVERIVVYIDDLDRCPPQRVVEILEATQLLLGLPIFVVVVAADARWVSRSIERHFPDLLSVGGQQGSWDYVPSRNHAANATSLDYLEKIVQIPFWLAPMEEEACERFVRGLLYQRGSSQAMSITEEEIKFIPRLAPLLGRTPRTVKRFLNIYGLIRGGIPEADFDAYLGKGSEPPTYKLVTLLLGLVTGEPELGLLVIRHLQRQQAKMPLEQWLTELGNDRDVKNLPEWGRLSEHVNTMFREFGSLQTVAAVQSWVLIVRRYSFLKPMR